MSQAPYAVRNARWGTPLGKDLKVCGAELCEARQRPALQSSGSAVPTGAAQGALPNLHKALCV